MAGTSYEHLTEVEEIARELIQGFHKDLVEANIAYLMRDSKTWTVKRKTCWGSAKKLSSETKFLTDDGDTEGYDFIITINASVWKGITQDMKKALVDHELCHCARGDDNKAGEPTWYIDGHTVEDFAAVIRRHGLWSEEIKMIVRAMEDSKVKQEVLIFDGQQGDKPSNVINMPTKEVINRDADTDENRDETENPEGSGCDPVVMEPTQEGQGQAAATSGQPPF